MHAYIPTYLRNVAPLAHCPLRQHDGAAVATSKRTTRRGFLPRLFRRREPTTFQRCLAVHMHAAARNGALD